MSTITLKHGDVVLAVLTYEKSGQPWFYFHFDAAPHWEDAKHLFEERRAELSGRTHLIYELESEQMAALDLHLFDTDSEKQVEFFVLQIEGDEAQFN